MNKASEGFELAGLLAKVAGGANQTSEAGGGYALDGAKRKKPFAVKIGDGTLDVGPGSVLSENGADDDLKAGAAGPPVLRAICGEERFVIFFKDWESLRQGRGIRRPRRAGGRDIFRQRRRRLDGF
jgi:hypothetical protein